MSKIKEELPCFIHYLLNELIIDDDIKGGRFCIKHYYNPELLELLHVESKEDRFQQLLTACLTQHLEADMNPDEAPSVVSWSGPAGELHALLRSYDPRETSDLLWAHNICGQMLLTLSKRPNPIVERGSEIRGLRMWSIKVSKAEFTPLAKNFLRRFERD